MAKKPTPAKSNQKNPKSPSGVKQAAAAVADALPQGWLNFAFIVLAITAACYLPTLGNGLVNWDDDPNITENPNLVHLGHGAMWGETVANLFDIDKGAVIGNYNPLPILTFGIEKSLAGGEFSPKLIHFDNLLLHLLTVFFVMKLLFSMGIGRWGVLAGGLLFGIHPMRVESVAWATERKDVLFAVFFFAALVYYVQWLKSEDTGKKTRLYIWMVVLAVLSMFSKVQAVTLPLSMLALDYWYRRPINFRLIWEKAPFWALSIAFGLINLYTLKHQGSTNDDITNFTMLDRLCIGMYSFCVYLYKLVIPFPMSPLYPYPKPLPIWVYISPVFFAAAWYGAWRFWKADRRIWVFGMVFFFFNVMFLLQVLGAGQGFLADRFTYVPYFGFFAIAAALFDEYMAQPKLRGNLQIALAVVTVIFGIWTVRQTGIWKNGETLWGHVIENEGKTNSLPYWNRAQYFRAQGKYDQSLKDYTQAIAINPEKPELYNSRGKTYFDMGTSEQYKRAAKEYLGNALADYDNGLSKKFPKPEDKSELLINRGAAYGASGNLQKSIEDVTEGLKLKPDNKNGYFNRSIAYYQTGQFDLALNDYKEYLKYDPFNANILYESGMLLRSMNKNDEAVANLTKAIQMQPTMGIAYLERARAYVQLNNKAAAVKDYQKAKSLGTELTVKDTENMNAQ